MMICRQLFTIFQGNSIPYKPQSYQTDEFGILSKSLITKICEDRFGAINPDARSASIRSLSFDVEKIKQDLEEYRNTDLIKIHCKIIIDDSSDSNDCNRKDLFSNFFDFSSDELIVPYKIGEENEEETLQNGCENSKGGNNGLLDAVTAVTAVTEV